MKKSILFLMMLLAATTVSAQDLVDRVSQAVGVELPSEYKQKVKDFVNTNKVMKDKGTAQFTEQFILEEMKIDWKISRQNQLLFIWHSIYHQITESNLYDGGDSDSNGKRMEEFNSKAISIRIRVCGSKFSLKIITYMEQRSAEAQQRSAEAQQRSAEAKQRSAEAKQRSAEAKQQSAEITKAGVSQIAMYYNLCKDHPTAIVKEELEETKKYAKHVIENCKKYNIDYKAILRKELGDEQKVKDLLKFYGIE